MVCGFVGWKTRMHAEGFIQESDLTVSLTGDEGL